MYAVDLLYLSYYVYTDITTLGTANDDVWVQYGERRRKVIFSISVTDDVYR